MDLIRLSHREQTASSQTSDLTVSKTEGLIDEPFTATQCQVVVKYIMFSTLLTLRRSEAVKSENLNPS